jgi:hypothetical protein
LALLRSRGSVEPSASNPPQVMLLLAPVPRTSMP